MKQIDDEEYRYFSYLLRAWQQASRGSGDWRYELESVQTGQKRTFPDLQAVYDYLQGRMEGLSDKSGTRPAFNKQEE